MKPLQDLVLGCNKGSRETEPVGSSGTRAGTTGSAAYMFALLILLLCFGPGNFSCPLRLDHNRLKGPIPRELAGLPNLGIVDFSNNDLCGAIPTDGAFQNIPRSSELLLVDACQHIPGDPSTSFSVFTVTTLPFVQQIVAETSGTTLTFVIIDKWVVTVPSIGDSHCVQESA
ncbi:hypothetical protein ZEAMMB73_Zm00001d015024 [Zea mays]|uniref:Uncharacterized protein n=1 Tax=Zea mays TaxID=4577 RepID=A0A1D6GYS4_MAIZE|nr:hypothetical protein ZEAMMB73_Zm00001d015024 [Zea mays]